ncbi:MAG: hypothetical protein KBA28_03045 [Syntrophaceae bacterium]|jgi:hypothetical protein|nr:hypothetical protein [Syntrophaceae bacterium]
MITAEQAGKMNTMAYYITGVKDGVPQFAEGTPDNMKSVDGFKVYDAHTGTNGQFLVAFATDAKDSAYIAARGTDGLADLRPDAGISINMTPNGRIDDATDYIDTISIKLGLDRYNIYGGGHSLGGLVMARASSQKGIYGIVGRS